MRESNSHHYCELTFRFIATFMGVFTAGSSLSTSIIIALPRVLAPQMCQGLTIVGHRASFYVPFITPTGERTDKTEPFERWNYVKQKYSLIKLSHILTRYNLFCQGKKCNNKIKIKLKPWNWYLFVLKKYMVFEKLQHNKKRHRSMIQLFFCLVA